MARRIAVFEVTVSADTQKSAAVSTDISFAPGPVSEVEIVIPDGHNGSTGFQLAQAGQAIIPEESGTYIVGNDEVIRWPLDGYNDAGSWQLIAYNTDYYDHTFYLRFLIADASNKQQPLAAIPLIV